MFFILLTSVEIVAQEIEIVAQDLDLRDTGKFSSEFEETKSYLQNKAD